MTDEYALYEAGSLLFNDNYKFVKNLQNGSFGKVSLALDTSTSNFVSIKAIPKVSPVKQLAGERSLAEIAQGEIEALQILNSPSTSEFDNFNICKLLDSFETKSYIVLVLEYCSKGDLYDLIHERTLSIQEIIKLSNQLHNAVQFAHSKSVYHRDIKPENILIDEDCNFKLCDWGLATTSRFSEDFNVGTEKYMAPECLLKDRTADGTYDCVYSDYWSFGVTILTAIFGTSPFKQPSSTKSVQADYNFKNFVMFNNPYILYDIYPSMNTNCFELFMNLLKVGSDEDDAISFTAKARSRDISKFASDLQSKWIYGLTVDDEVHDEYLESSDDVSAQHADVFDMDHDDLQFSCFDTKPSSIDDEEEYDSEFELVEYNAVTPNIPINSPTKKPLTTNSQASMKLPSLVESSMKSSVSWCDLDDEDDWALDTDVSQVLDRLNLETPVKNDKANKIPGSSKDQVRIFDQDLGTNYDAKVINWFDC